MASGNCIADGNSEMQCAHLFCLHFWFYDILVKSDECLCISPIEQLMGGRQIGAVVTDINQCLMGVGHRHSPILCNLQLRKFTSRKDVWNAIEKSCMLFFEDCIRVKYKMQLCTQAESLPPTIISFAQRYCI